MEDRYLITVIGRQTVDGETDTIEVITTGDCTEENGRITITYPEFAEEDPNIRTDTTVVLDGGRLSIERRGEMSSRLMLEKGVRHQCLYDTPMGSMMIGIFTDSITADLSPAGGDIRASYQLDFNNHVVSTNEFHISIKEK
jgi:uncharacterized beta-barrel protein YwiB (DUF1934 family)